MVWKSIGVVSPVKHGRPTAHRAMLTTYSSHVVKKRSEVAVAMIFFHVTCKLNTYMYIGVLVIR